MAPHGIYISAVTLPAGVIYPAGVDTFLPDFLGHGFLAVHGVLVETDPLHRNGFLLDHGAFLVKGHFALFLADGREDIAAPRLASMMGSRSIMTSSRCTGTVLVTFSVVTYLLSRARPVALR